jgi:cytochrome c biogenesis protein CcmG/thiol:disulfide interchange protein DsbE
MVGLQLDPNELPSPLLEKQAPEFSLPDLQDPTKTVGTADFKGKVVVLNVWATWCVACRQEHSFLLRLANRKEVSIYGLNWRDQKAPAIKWLEELGDPYTATAFDFDGKVGIDWGVYGAPETFLIGPDGTVLYKHISPLNEAVWQEEFVPRIAAAEKSQ